MATIRIWWRVVRADHPEGLNMEPFLEQTGSFVRSYGNGVQYCAQVTAGPLCDDWEVFLDADEPRFHHLVRVSSEIRAILNEKTNLAASREFFGKDMRQWNYLLREIDDIKLSVAIVARDLDRTKYDPLLRHPAIKAAKLVLKRIAR